MILVFGVGVCLWGWRSCSFGFRSAPTSVFLPAARAGWGPTSTDQGPLAGASWGWLAPIWCWLSPSRLNPQQYPSQPQPAQPCWLGPSQTRHPSKCLHLLLNKPSQVRAPPPPRAQPTTRRRPACCARCWRRPATRGSWRRALSTACSPPAARTPSRTSGASQLGLFCPFLSVFNPFRPSCSTAAHRARISKDSCPAFGGSRFQLT